MQPDLPWNVAGIPPEAREAARASARREGLSVGEWLTRRILRSFSDSADDERNWHRSTLADMEASMSAASSARETDDMLDRVSRSESESRDSYRRIEEQLRGVARRLDATERNQSENNRVMNKAATEMNVTAREQAQAFEQLGTHVVKLTDRLARIEHQASSDPLRDAVKGLHQGLTRLADQMSESARQSTEQVSSLAHNIDTLAGKLAEAERATRALEEKIQSRVAALDERLQARVAELDERMKPAEKAGDAVDRLAARFSANESETAGAMTRLEESVHRLERDGGATAAMDKRLQAIEHALADIVGRLDASEHTAPQTNKIEDSLEALSRQIEASDKRNRETVSDLRAALKDTAARIDAMDGRNVRPMPQAPMAAVPAMDATPVNFDLPPFPLEAPPQAAPAPFEPVPGGSFDLPPPPYDMTPAPGTENMYAPPPYLGGSDFPQPQAASAASAESYIAAARRNARATVPSPERSARAPMGSFTWGAPQHAAVAAKAKGGKSRFALIGAIVLIAAVAALAGITLSRGLKHTVAVPPPATSTPVPRAQAASPNYNVLPPAEPATTDGVDQSKPAPDAKATTALSSPRIAAPPPAAAKPQPAKPAPSPLERLTALANAGNARAETALGLTYLDGTGVAVNEAEAARWLERAANQGQPVAAYRLGTLYERGHGVPADKAKAVEWYTVAANAGNRKAMHNLAVAYAEGSGVAKDLAEAANWFTKAATLGLADSQFNLAVLYERGMGVPQSLTNAYKWYAIAASQGDSESKARIDALSTQIAPADKDAATRAAQNFKPMAMDRAANVPPDAGEFTGG